MKVVVGLGNPGEKYANTPHSIGYEVVDGLALRSGCGLRGSLRFSVRSARTIVGGTDILLVKPQTYMNVSGPAVAELLRYRRVDPSDMIVVLDDADLDVGRIRIRRRVTSGGHKGLQSIVDSVGTDAFVRVRIGIGRGKHGADLVHHVLDHFTPEERVLTDKVVDEAVGAVICILTAGVDEAMNGYNAKLMGECKEGG